MKKPCSCSCEPRKKPYNTIEIPWKNLVSDCVKPRKNGTSTKTVTSSRHNIRGMVYNVPNPASHAEYMPAWVARVLTHKLMPWSSFLQVVGTCTCMFLYACMRVLCGLVWSCWQPPLTLVLGFEPRAPANLDTCMCVCVSHTYVYLTHDVNAWYMQSSTGMCI